VRYDGLRLACLCVVLLGCSFLAQAQDLNVTAQIEIVREEPV